MALTNFGLLTDEQKTIWSKQMWKQARNYSFINQFLGSDANAVIQHITELKKSEKGARAVITLLTDLEGDGIAGDRTLEGNEEAMQSYDQVIRLDQLRHANRHEGRMADQKSIVEFRTNSRNQLAYWLADRLDQLAFLTMAGLAYSVKNSGGTRTGSDLTYLEYAADVVAPSAKRVARWDGTSATKTLVIGGASTAVVATDLPMWELFVQLKAYAKDNYIRGTKEAGGEENYHAFLPPTAMAKLKLDPTYLLNVRHAQPRSEMYKLFSGAVAKIDGIYLHEFRHVPNTRLAASGSKYGSGGTVEGCQMLFCGAQALGMADIGAPEWVEKGFDYENQQGISVQKICGFLKPQFYTQYSGGTVEDHGLISVYMAM
ncbi:MAG: N4-gp56 family major capsid protein [Lysobacterales bacterium]|nr:MAG: N4-gp56 family major capsid protein [Xanthomonadales bacterium]